MTRIHLAAFLRGFSRWWRRGSGEVVSQPLEDHRQLTSPVSPLVDIAPDDPIIPYFLSTPGAVEINTIALESPALQTLKAAGVKLVVPLVSQGELIGLLNLGPRRSQQDYSRDDRALLTTLAAQAAPAVRVAQMVREQQAAALERERIEQELRVARLIQHTLLPKELPILPGWHLAKYYMPARAVGGDFYDFLDLGDQRLGIVIGDVTDKGIPAALVMATTRSIIRSIALDGLPTGKVLERANDMLCHDIPSRMFVTCLYAILDPASGRLRYANAGHDLPYRWHNGEVHELLATGMPLGLMPSFVYEESEITITPGESLLFYSDGLVESHNPQGEMFSFARLRAILRTQTTTTNIIRTLLNALNAFTGDAWEQEDDVTLVMLHRQITSSAEREDGLQSAIAGPDPAASHFRTLTRFSLPSAPGNERLAMQQVALALQETPLPARKLEQLMTALAEATMNAMEHGNHYQETLPVFIQVDLAPEQLVVRITDYGGLTALPDPAMPDIEAKLAGQQPPRGWGFFLIKHMGDNVSITGNGKERTIALILNLQEECYADKTI